MSVLAAIALGLLAVGYAVWPALKMRDIAPLDPELPEGYSLADAEAEGAVLRAWSVAAGELSTPGPLQTRGRSA